MVSPLIWTGERKPRARQLLSQGGRARLAALATVVRFKKGAKIYGSGDRADSVYCIVSGVAKSYSSIKGRQQTLCFLFPNDVFGLPINGHYMNYVRALTPVVAHRLPVARLKGHLLSDADLQFHVICKLCDELRRSLRHAVIIGEKDATTKIAMFLRLMEELRSTRSESLNEIHLPMSRTDIAEFVSLSLPAVSRGFRKLSDSGVIKIRDHRYITVLDRRGLNRYVREHTARTALGEKTGG
jgi:CRP/FNR family transcriptional regulator